MARAHVSSARSAVARPTTGGGLGPWVLGGLIAILLAAVAGYFVLVGGTQRSAPYAPPAATAVPATIAPATAAPATGAPAPAATAPAPAAPRYP